MKIKSILLLALTLSFSAAAFGQKAEPAKPSAVKLPAASEIIANYVKALGGRQAYEKTNSRMVKGTMEMSPMGIKGSFESYTAAPGKSFTKMNIAGIGEIVDVYDGKGGWASNPMQGSREKSGAELMQAKLINNFYREVNLEKLYPAMEVKGIEKVGVNDAYVVAATPTGLAPETFYFDVKTGGLLRHDFTMLAPEGNQNPQNFYEDVRMLDGIMIPYKVRTIVPQMEMIMTMTEVKHNVTVDETKFTKPKQ